MKRYIILATIGAMCLTSCEDFLTKEDPNKVDAPSYFRNETDLETYANGFLQRMLPDAEAIATGDQHTDYLSWRGPWNYLQDNFNADDQGGWTWTNLRNINYYLDNMERADCSEAIKNHYVGVGRFWRAWFYFNMVKQFGAVPWYEHVIDSEDNGNLFKSRDNREDVMRKILEDIDFASKNCITSKEMEVNSVRVTKYVALALKARICLFEGTFRKYHANDPSTGTPWTADESAMYLRECADACEKLIQSGRYSIVNNAAQVKTQYRELFTTEAINTNECIWARAYNASLNVTHHLNSQFIVQQNGSFAAVKEFVNTYLNTDGTRFTDKPGYEKIPFNEEFTDRDARMAQSLRHPGYTRKSNGSDLPQPPNFNYSSTGYQPIKWVIDDMSLDQSVSPCNNSIPIIRYAEVLLSYAEAKAELGEFTEGIWNQTIKPLRERAGVVGTMPATTDPYMAGYFLNTVSDKVILEIRRERGIELFMENLRWADCMRWRMGRLLEREWHGIYVPAMNVNYDLDGDGTPDVCFVEKQPSSTTKGVQYRIIGSDFQLTDGTSGNLVSYRSIERKWDDKKYVRPIPTKAITDNPNLGQNPGWGK